MTERIDANTRRKVRRIGFKTVEQLDAWLVTTRDYAALSSVGRYLNNRQEPHRRTTTKFNKHQRTRELVAWGLTKRQARRHGHELSRLMA